MIEFGKFPLKLFDIACATHTLPGQMPREVVIFAIEVQDVTTFGESCTSKVERAIPKVIQRVARELTGRGRYRDTRPGNSSQPGVSSSLRIYCALA